jgi:hypothetical protein
MGIPLRNYAHRQRGAEPNGLHTFDLPGSVDASIEKTITIRLADCDGERSTANMLINRKYGGRGYGAGHKVPTASNCVTFTASSGASLIGTLSLTVDSEDGLACDKTFKDELDAFRAVPGARLCELTKFAFDTSKPSMHLLASLFHIIFIYGTHHYNCTDLFIEVNPRHRRFYQAMLGFQPVGKPRTNEAVGAPSYLMSLKVSEIRRLIDEHARNASAGGHSLYGFFFSKKEELGIYNRLANPHAEPAPIARASSGAAAAVDKVRNVEVTPEHSLVAAAPLRRIPGRPQAPEPALA